MDEPVLPDLACIDTLRKLIAGEIVWSTPPWRRRRGADSTYQLILEKMCRGLRLQSKIVWDCYGSGYASYVDAWFFRSDLGFRPEEPSDHENDYVGLWVLLSRYTPFFVMGEGRKAWEVGRGFSYLPDFESVDQFENPAVIRLSAEVTDYLISQKLVRLYREDVCSELPADLKVETNLASRPFRVFDALYNWMD